MHRQQVLRGEFVPSDQRIEKSIDFKATHFQLRGGGCRTQSLLVGEFPRSTNQVNYKPLNIQAAQRRQTIDSNMIRRTNFVLGNEKFRGRTTHGDTYIGQAGAQAQKNDKTAKDLRNAHFVFGLSSGAYLTENQREYVKKQAIMEPKQIEAQKELVGKIRGHHFNLGTSNPSFLTTNTATYGSHPLGQSKSTGKIGQDLRTAHFDLGKESTPFVTTHQMDYTKKTGERANINNLNTQGTSIRFNGYTGAQPMIGQSVSHGHFQKWPLNHQKPGSQVHKGLRGTHFILGNSESTGVMMSQNHGQYVQKRPMSVGLKSKVTQKESHFTIGDPNYKENNFTTIYDVSCEGNQISKKSASVGKLALKSTLNLGKGGPGQYVSEFKSNYVPVHGKAEEVDRSYLKLVKGDHFPQNQSLPGQYSTETNTCFNYKGKAKQIRSELEQSKKDDLRKSHFQIGASNGDFNTINQMQYTKKSQAPSEANKNAAYNLRHKTFRIGVQGRGLYSTEQRDQYLWVQPTPAKKN